MKIFIFNSLCIFSRLLIKLPELNYQVKVKASIDK